jgi:hypothetical protein
LEFEFHLSVEPGPRVTDPRARAECPRKGYKEPPSTIVGDPKRWYKQAELEASKVQHFCAS